MNARKITIAASFAAAVLALSGCNAGNAETPTQQPSKEASASPTKASQSPMPSKKNEYKPASEAGPAENVPIPKMPAEANEKTEEGAVAFLEHYLKMMNYAFESYETTELVKLSSDDCKVCFENIILGIDFNDKQGGWQSGGAYKFKIYSVKTTESESLLGFSMAKEPSVLYKSDGTVASKSDKQVEPVHAVALLKYSNGWIVNSISINGKE